MTICINHFKVHLRVSYSQIIKWFQSGGLGVHGRGTIFSFLLLPFHLHLPTELLLHLSRAPQVWQCSSFPFLCCPVPRHHHHGIAIHGTLPSCISFPAFRWGLSGVPQSPQSEWVICTFAWSPNYSSDHLPLSQCHSCGLWGNRWRFAPFFLKMCLHRDAGQITWM